MSDLAEKIKDFSRRYLSDGFFIHLVLFLFIFVVGAIFIESIFKEIERLRAENEQLKISISIQRHRSDMQREVIRHLSEPR